MKLELQAHAVLPCFGLALALLSISSAAYALAADIYEPDDTSAQASSIADGETQNRTIHVVGDEDYVAFTLSATSDVVLETNASTGDTAIWLFDSTITEVGLAIGDGGYTRLAEPNLPAGTYYAWIREVWGSFTLDYTLSLTVASPKPDLLFEDVTLSPSCPGPGDTVTFTITILNRGGVDAGVFNVGFWPTWAGSGPEITDIPDQNADVSGVGAGATATVDFVVAKPSIGSVEASVYIDRANGIGDVAEFDETNNVAWFMWEVIAPDAYEPDDDFDLAKPIAIGETQTHSFHDWADYDYVVFSIGTTSDVVLEVNAVWGEIVLYLYDSTRSQIASGVGTFSSPRICETGLPPGTYYAMVGDFWEDRIPSYILHLDVQVPDLYEDDDTFDQAKPISEGDVQTHSIHELGDQDYVEFFLSGISNVVIETDGWFGDTALHLYDSGRNLIASDSGGFPRISQTGLAAGTYYAMVEESGTWGYDTITSYTLSLTMLVPDLYEDDDSFAQAKPISEGDVQTHSIHELGDQDYVVFDLSSTSDVVLETHGTVGDTVLYLYDSSQTLITSDDEGGAGNFSQIIQTGLAAGTYYAMVERWFNNETITSYTLRFTFLVADIYEDDDTFAQSRLISDGELQTHSIQEVGDKDYVLFFLSEISDVVLQTDGVSGDTVLYLYDSSQNFITCNDDDGYGANDHFSSISEPRLAAGAYYAMVEEYGNGGTIASYTLQLDVVPDIETVSTPDTPSGPSSGDTCASHSYSTGGASSDFGHSVEYRFDWGDGNYSEWSSSTSASHIWPSAGTYNVSAQARCADHPTVMSSWSAPLAVTIDIVGLTGSGCHPSRPANRLGVSNVLVLLGLALVLLRIRHCARRNTDLATTSMLGRHCPPRTSRSPRG